MSERAGRVPRYVVLPWAQQHGPAVERSTSHTQIEAVELRVAGHIKVSADSFREERWGDDRGATGRALDPALTSLGLPYEPAPSIPSEDRGHFDEEHLVAVGVALDILATMTATIRDTPTVLQELVQALAYVGQLGGLDADKVNGLLSFAQGPVATRRARISAALAACQARATGETNHHVTDGAAAPSTPASVVQSIRQLEDTARLVVREAVLLLYTKDPIDYRQA